MCASKRPSVVSLLARLMLVVVLLGVGVTGAKVVSADAARDPGVSSAPALPDFERIAGGPSSGACTPIETGGTFPVCVAGMTRPTGGLPTGGVPTGGLPTGGVPTGGVPTGGLPTGGRSLDSHPAVLPGGSGTNSQHPAGECGQEPIPVVECELWVSTYEEHGIPSFNPGPPRGLAVSPDGTRVYVTFMNGQQCLSHELKICAFWWVTFAADATTGERLWTTEFWGSGRIDQAFPTDLALSPDGETVYVSGYRWAKDGCASPPFCWKLAVVAYDATSGEERSVMTYPTLLAGHGVMNNVPIAVSPDGKTIYAGGMQIIACGPNGCEWGAFAVAFDAGTGAISFVTRLNDTRPEAGNVGPVDMVVSPDGKRLFATHASRSSRDGTLEWDYSTVAHSVDPTDGTTLGERMWVARHDHGPEELPAMVGISPDGERVYVTGLNFSPIGPGSGVRPNAKGAYVTVAYRASDGAQLWADPIPAASYAYPSLAVSPTGDRVFVGGSPADSSFVTVAYRGDSGTREWAATHAVPGHFNRLGSLVAAPDGARVYAVGNSYNNQNNLRRGEQVIAAYRASDGTLAWTARRNDSGLDYPQSPALIEVSRDGGFLFTAATFWRMSYPGVQHFSQYVGVAAYRALPEDTP